MPQVCARATSSLSKASISAMVRTVCLRLDTQSRISRTLSATSQMIVEMEAGENGFVLP